MLGLLENIFQYKILSNINQSVDLKSKSINWFLYDASFNWKEFLNITYSRFLEPKDKAK